MNLLLLFYKVDPTKDQREKILGIVKSGKLIHNVRLDI